MRFTDIYSLLTEDKLSDELARSSLSQEQKEKVREINSLLSNKTKYISWLVKNITDLPDDIDMLLNWFQARNDLEDKDISHYSVEKLQALRGERSNTKSQERKRIHAVTDDEGAERIYQKGPVTAWRVKQPEWLRKNFANANWCVSSSEYKKQYKKYTTKYHLTFYVIHDGSRPRYNQSTGQGDPYSDVCIGVDTHGRPGKDARQTADNNDMGDGGVVLCLHNMGIDPKLLGLPVVEDPISDFWEKILKNSKVEVYDHVEGKRVAHGNVVIPPNPWLTSLEGLGVDKVEGGFYCSGCTGLTSLEYCPTSVGGDFSCSGCTSLTSLEHCPTSVKYNFFCSRCTSLKSLEHCPNGMQHFVCADCISLTSLEHCPVNIKGDFKCDGCVGLTSLEHCPTTVGFDFCCDGCVGLTSLEHCPTSVGWNFSCVDCGVKFSKEDVESKCKVGKRIIT